jgi:hypothetical protein
VFLILKIRRRKLRKGYPLQNLRQANEKTNSMAKTDMEKRSQQVEDIFNEIQGYLIGKLPYGSEINLLLNARTNIRKNRLNRFFESFREELEKIYGKPLDSDRITSEEFLDVMEAIMIRVQSTKSSYKVERFRNILLKQAINPIDYQLALKYVQVIDELTDVQMIMLGTFTDFNSIRSYRDFGHLIWKKYNSEENAKNFDFNDFTIEQDELVIPVNYKELKFYSSDLIAKGLIENRNEDKLSIPNMKFQGWPTGSNDRIAVKREKNESYALTEFAINILKFVATEDDKREL